jgi:hypothetical protein
LNASEVKFHFRISSILYLGFKHLHFILSNPSLLPPTLSSHLNVPANRFTTNPNRLYPKTLRNHEIPLISTKAPRFCCTKRLFHSLPFAIKELHNPTSALDSTRNLSLIKSLANKDQSLLHQTRL